MKVLSVASECAPLVKTGGLADVVGALPGALAKQGVEMRVLIPGYPAVMERLSAPERVYERTELYGAAAWLLAETVDGIDLLVIDAPHLFGRSGSLYSDEQGVDWADNPERFAALSRIAADIATGVIGWQPDVVHCHDWQAGLAPYYIARSDAASRVATILTVHNIAFQGRTSADRAERLGILTSDFHADGVEYWGDVSTLKAGLNFATRLTTVSPTYADELMRPEFGMGLDGVLRRRRAELLGILNGVDTGFWNPETDREIHTYRTPRGKAKNKTALRDEFGLPDAGGPLCVVISRMTEQKGLDLLLDALPTLTGRGGQLALLGSGEADLEAAYREAAEHPQISVKIGYDEALSHRMIAGGDAILVPSRFEPCGLTQLMGLAYGALPLVALTGGLADTVIPSTAATEVKGVATGLQFHPVTTEALSNALAKLCDLYDDPKAWGKMQRNAMAHPVGWDMSARAYADLYRSIAPSL